ncbi:MAG: hypothetical protein KDK63_00580 [Chlamydiia bacterium]|nr:hypothetical protein [Chlamydiia bacterium]MCB1115303.1 hypothetical protein [Chlamydiia bacterium]
MKVQKLVVQIREEFKKYSRGERFFLLFAMLCGFFITAEYAITKPTSNSIFLAHYSVKLYPYAWLLTVPLNLVVVALYNRFLAKLGCFRMFLCTTIVTMVVNFLSGLYVNAFPPLAFLLYVWKDIYVLLMFQQLWSVIHTKAVLSKAKYLYGIIFGVSGVGAIFGSLVPSFFAVKLGSEHLLFLTVPLYLLFIAAYRQMLNRSAMEGEDHLQIKQAKGGMKLIRSNRTLQFILTIVILMQLSTTIMDFQFNTFLQTRYPIQDLRTEFYGRLWGMINTCKLCLQFFATFLLVQFMGLKRSHFVVPGILLGNAVLTLFKPTFSVITYSYSALKTFDYSIFNILKEMLYVPLKTDEKFKAKAVIDVFAYRSAKALASLFVIALGALAPEKLPYAYSWGPFALFTLWIGAVFLHFSKKASRAIQLQN